MDLGFILELKQIVIFQLVFFKVKKIFFFYYVFKIYMEINEMVFIQCFEFFGGK